MWQTVVTCLCTVLDCRHLVFNVSLPFHTQVILQRLFQRSLQKKNFTDEFSKMSSLGIETNSVTNNFKRTDLGPYLLAFMVPPPKKLLLILMFSFMWNTLHKSPLWGNNNTQSMEIHICSWNWHGCTSNLLPNFSHIYVWFETYFLIQYHSVGIITGPKTKEILKVPLSSVVITSMYTNAA